MMHIAFCETYDIVNQVNARVRSILRYCHATVTIHLLWVIGFQKERKFLVMFYQAGRHKYPFHI
jgi:hypothetical protein